MGLYDMTDGTLHEVSRTSFAAENILERTHLQAALRDNIALIGKDLLVVAEEFGDFTDAHRRIDLLCIDRAARPVVVELKRTGDGGHMELQALRYAAMVSTMTFGDLEQIYRRHLTAVGGDPEEAEATLADWLDEGADAVVSREVRIVLVSAGFDKEITTTVLWLNELFQLDIQCIRLTPYRIAERLLLDVQQVVPLPEAADLSIQLKRREHAAKAAATSGRDLTRYIVRSPAGNTEPLPKRRAIHALVEALHNAGVPGEALLSAMPTSKFLSVEGELEDDELIEAFIAAYPAAKNNLRRWFFESPFADGGRTWVLSKMWGLNTEAALSALVALAPRDLDFGFEAA
jgi:hypothetical protein